MHDTLHDDLTDVAGLAVGHATHAARPTGCTVVLCEGDGAVCGVAQRGGAPGTRETDLLRPENWVQRVHAVLLTGGSAYGLDAASGVMQWLEAHDRGFVVGAGGATVAPLRVPIVPAAVLFDLWTGDGRIRADAALGRQACEAATRARIAQGNVGAGAGASVGKLFGFDRAMRGGIGSASLRVEGLTVAALVAANPLGDVLDESGRVLAGARQAPGSRDFIGCARAVADGGGPAPAMAAMRGTATTIGIVATDARLDKAQATQLASLAHAGLARAVSPLTLYDGDTFFALATGAAGRTGDLSTLGAMAAECVARAIRRAVRAASPLADPPLPAVGG